MQPIEDASNLLLCFVWRLQSCFCRSRDGPDSAQASTSDGVSDSRHDSEAAYRDQLNCSASAQALHDARQQLQTAGDTVFLHATMLLAVNHCAVPDSKVCCQLHAFIFPQSHLPQRFYMHSCVANAVSLHRCWNCFA